MTDFFPVFADECRKVRVLHFEVKRTAPITSVQCHGTFGSLTFRGNGANLASVSGLPLWLGKGVEANPGGDYEVYLRVLRGVGVRGGPLGFQAGANASG